MKSFYSNGKLLLTGEYAVLNGALALAIPTKFGQSLTVTENDSSQLVWKSFDEEGQLWFEGIYDLGPLIEVSTSDSKISKTLLRLLQETQRSNPNFLMDSSGYKVENKLDFPRNWGLGTSSTLINNVAKWAKVDPYTLLASTFGGSGYDIACAQNDTPITYQINNGKPEVKKIDFAPPFSKSLYFIYRGQKQNSREAIAAYRNLKLDKEDFMTSVSVIATMFSTRSNLKDFQYLMEVHENELSKVLGIPPIKSEYFPDYSGAVKSLGAWGGDFILAAGDEHTPTYFQKKGLTTVIPFDDMIL